ncbi:MAG: hypothetical protein COT28_16290 [Methylobacterium sp. CG08_land_8_20_14_0_20_71_15]|nr:MAG: hypothetical protein COT56_15305 [Methylobacterium sp. CG09_land_8_20_14_0_10_71_15]PIU12180.1 MAG: hypothetical protein COT28_16290 [Methylobacterium sp. CG08_land_8_20_14_0_20_71_15]GBU18178.1 hypothetical protein AwMethylo_23930 [Methylobacterium sp.]
MPPGTESPRGAIIPTMDGIRLSRQTGEPLSSLVAGAPRRRPGYSTRLLVTTREVAESFAISARYSQSEV